MGDDFYRVYQERSRLYRVFRHRDFRFLWTGAFLSFVGSWIQKIAEGWLVWQLTHNNYLLALVIPVASLPTTILGPIAGTLADTFNRRTLLVVTQILFAAGAFYLSAATYFHFVSYIQILIVAFLLGLVGTVEQPARQSTVSSCVPPEDLPLAIPINAMTFNLSRIVGPAIGGLLLATVGTAACYFVNGVSFFALIFAALALRSDLSPRESKAQPVKDLIIEGALYTYRDRRLRTLFVLELLVSACGLVYISQMPAIVAQMLHRAGDPVNGPHDRFIYSSSYFVIGVGAITALSIIMRLADRPLRAMLIRTAMMTMAVALLVLGFVRNEWVAYPIFIVLGMCSITQFNLTNTLFQTLAPPRLRGRVLAMHMWALNGLGPFGILAFGYIAQRVNLPIALQIGGAIILIGATWAWFNGGSLKGVDNRESFYGVPDDAVSQP